MEELINSIGRTLKSLFAPRMFGILIMTVIITIFALMGFIAIITFLTTFVPSIFGFSILEVFPFAGFFAGSFIALLLFPAFMPIIISFFDVQIIEIIEEQDYPSCKPLKGKFGRKLMRDIRFALMVIILNIIVIPFYFVPLLNIILFPLLNGVLFGREFFMIAARRHLPIKEAKKMRRQNSGIIVLGGIIFIIIATIPIVNLIAPFWGIAMMTHLFHHYYADSKPQAQSGFKIL